MHLFHQFVEQTLAGVFKEFEGELEVASGAVVGIWNGLLAWMMAQIVAHAEDLLEIGRGVGLTGHIVVILLIHHSDEVEAREVLRRKLTSTMVEDITMSLATLSHTTIWQLANVPRADTSRIDQELVVESSLRHKVLHNAVSSWRTADIT